MTDLISRADAIEAVTSANPKDREYHYYKHIAVSIIEALPSVDRPKGEWVPVIDSWGDVITTVDGYKCSKCGEFNPCKDNFCPSCGADMRGGDAEMLNEDFRPKYMQQSRHDDGKIDSNT